MVVSVTTLSAGFESGRSDPTPITLLSDPPTDGVKVTCTSALAFGASGPRLHVTSRFPLIVHAPWLDDGVPATP